MPRSSAHNVIIPQPQEAAMDTPRKLFTIGLPAPSDPTDHRFPLTPEGARQLTDRGFEILMQRGAAATIHYTDAQYAECGVQLVEATRAWGADIVIQLARVSRADVGRMRRGAMLLTLIRPLRAAADDIKALLEQHIVTIALDLIEDTRGNLPFADILAEIAGRAAIVSAVSLLADSLGGKGILLGGATGVVPCEVTVIGSGIAARAAAAAAVGNGALVRMFDDDIYSLRCAEHFLGSGVVTSALHPRVLVNALRSADVVVYATESRQAPLSEEALSAMKRGVLIFDLTDRPGAAFPGITACNIGAGLDALPLAGDTQRRLCYLNAHNAVARTTAMALSNTLLTMLSDLLDCEGMTNAMRLLPGVRTAVLTFMGKPVNKEIARRAGMRQADINIFLTLS